MRRMHRAAPCGRGFRACALVILTALTASGCAAHWRPIQRDRIASTLRETQPDNARVITVDSVVMVHHPAVLRDTLRGTLQRDRGIPVAVPLAEVDTLSLYRPDRAPTWVFVGTTMAMAMLFVGLLLAHPGPVLNH